MARQTAKFRASQLFGDGFGAGDCLGSVILGVLGDFGWSCGVGVGRWVLLVRFGRLAWGRRGFWVDCGWGFGGGLLGWGGGGGIEVLGGAVVRRVRSATSVGVVGVRLTPLTYVRGSVWGGSVDHGLDGGFRGDVAMLKAGWTDGAVDVEAGVVAFVEGLAGLSLVAADFGEELDGAVEAAGEMCVVAGELDERLSAADQHGSAEEFVVAFAAGIDGFGALRPVPAEDVVDVGGDDGRLDAGEALHSPLRVDDLATDFVFQRISREGPVLESGELAVEVGGVFAGEHGVPCE